MKSRYLNIIITDGNRTVNVDRKDTCTVRDILFSTQYGEYAPFEFKEGTVELNKYRLKPTDFDRPLSHFVAIPYQDANGNRVNRMKITMKPLKEPKQLPDERGLQLE